MRDHNIPLNEPINTINIPYIHPKLKLSDLQENGKLLTDAQIAAIDQNEKIKSLLASQGRITKKALNEIFKNEINNGLLTKFNFSIEKSGDTYGIIYKGQDQSLGKGAFGSVKLLMNPVTGETNEVLKVVKNILPEDSLPKEIAEEKIGLEMADQFRGLHKRQDNRVPELTQYEFVMDLAKGSSLDKFAKSTKNLPTVVWIDMLIAVLQEVKSLHDRGILHCDIKPENIHFDPITKKATLVDLGLASITTDIRKGEISDTPKGTPSNMSPEVWERINNEKTEIFALGITFADILNLTDVEDKYIKYIDEDMPVLVVRAEDNALIDTKIADKTTRQAILTLLQTMTNDNNNLSLQATADHTNLIESFSRIRNEYIDALGLTNKVCYLDVATYAQADAVQKQEMLTALAKTDEVWLIDENGANKNLYLSVQHELIDNGLNVSNSVIQYQENNLDQVMRSYAAQREQSDRNIYDTSYLTKTGQLAHLETTLNESQVNKIIASLNQEINKISAKYGPKGERFNRNVKESIANIQKIHKENPITLDKALRELDKLQTTMLSATESQQNIIQLMKDIEKSVVKAPVLKVRGFDAVKKHQNIMQQLQQANQGTPALSAAANDPVVKAGPLPPPLPPQQKANVPPPLPPEYQKAKMPPPLPPEYQKAKMPPPLPTQHQKASVPPPLPPQYQKANGPPPIPPQYVKANVPPPIPKEYQKGKMPPPVPVALQEEMKARQTPEYQNWMQNKNVYDNFIQVATSGIHKSLSQQNKNRFKQFANDEVLSATTFYIKLLESASTTFQRAIILHSLLENPEKKYGEVKHSVAGQMTAADLDSTSEKSLFQAVKGLDPKKVESFLASLEKVANSKDPFLFKDKVVEQLKQLDPTPENTRTEAPQRRVK